MLLIPTTISWISSWNSGIKQQGMLYVTFFARYLFLKEREELGIHGEIK